MKSAGQHKISCLCKLICEWLVGVLTLLLAVNHHEAEFAREATDGSRWQSQQGSEPLPMRLAEAHYRVWSAGRPYVLAPLQTFDPW